ncbi:bifunctional diguanylate cyclase/phosphodiesterase [Phaeobacter sp. QD34_3]|uniref:putative bifunctional diguanylate cyclase/phosphodiesterase n=1 Tax=unclassified Phaeobacter TaxID=2621772 RepID=UPI00237F667B|nr:MULTISPECIES: bifunctional diguanylate cyclase/phosphodiesterase [unclassified Phaeobacter]MDE4134136.1 bifunctional diguanylate cyclase/phosphodiesterase [Phaeobacter sp. QD34_3]MDE4137941.1 bifunctional diguanylate cyclase/phosphodiesterase [Phaeobacter sp. QD34_24]
MSNPNSAFPGTAPAAETEGCSTEQRAEIDLCLVRHGYNNYLSNIVVNVACGLGLYAEFYITGNNSALVTALIVGLLVLSLGRVLAGRSDIQRLQAADTPPSDVARGARRYFLGMSVGVALWGTLLHLALQSGNDNLKYFAIIVVSAMASGATGVIAPLLKSGRVYISGLLIVIIAELQLQPEPQHVLSLLVATFWGVMLVTHGRNHNILRNSIELQMRNRSLVDDLRVQQEALTEFNATLEDRVKRRTSDLKRLAERDSLTQLYNRRGIIQWVEDQRHRIPEGHAFAVIFIDLDRFKQINDGMGHATGDCTLAEIGQRLAEAAPDLCAFCRWGGDEFVGLLAAPEDRCADIGHEFTAQLRAIVQRPVNFSNREVSVGFSAGLAVCRPHPVAVSEAIRSADLAAGEIKRTGRGNTLLYSQDLVAEQERTLIIAQRLKHALASEEMHLAFQPLVCSDDFSVHSYEVLLRWDNPILGRISPEEFIPIAEDIGEIVNIGEFVLDTALATYTEELGRASHIRLALNISLRQLVVPGFAEFILGYLDKYDLPPRMLILEVTETIVDARNQDAIIGVLNDLHSLGIEIHIDDFGTGYSSLSRLHEMPISALKIDKSFVQQIDDQRCAIIEGSVMIAERFGVHTVAEGVETLEQARLLHAIGVTYLQGYLFGKPVEHFAEVTVDSDFLIWSQDKQSKAS